ncbi:hypothetical protein [Alteraurantiacibacter palmitatis]|uniref:Uncharacterized protein n=1 Tax=Alteraurantiacibacter palmitatis TaxID=2054628 RepID=A0ABV7E6Y3_9SPHN
MAATDIAITLATFIRFEAPGGDVLLADGGVVKFGGDTFDSWHAVFGAIQKIDVIRSTIGDMAERGKLVLAPNPEASVSSWYNFGIRNARVRVWMGELEADGVTCTDAKRLADWQVDEITRVQMMGQDLLQIDMIGRGEKLFLTNEGNVCSDRFHQSLFPGERGFENCTDEQGYFAWGAESPQRANPVRGGSTPTPTRGRGRVAGI